jgi:hypothetical protein
VSPFFNNTANVTAQAVLTADRRFVRLSLNFNFTGITGARVFPTGQFVSPIFPGGPPRGR